MDDEVIRKQFVQEMMSPARVASMNYREHADAQLRFLHEVMKEIHETTEDADNPRVALHLIRIKAQVALRAVAQSGLLS